MIFSNKSPVKHFIIEPSYSKMPRNSTPLMEMEKAKFLPINRTENL